MINTEGRYAILRSDLHSADGSPAAVTSVSMRMGSLVGPRQTTSMSWKTIRLELARSPGFPDGSPERSYLIHLPVNDHGIVDLDQFRRAPELATVHRRWPGERDRSGYVIHKRAGWAFSYAVGDLDDENVFHLERHPLRVGEYVTVTEPDGDKLPYRVTMCEARAAA